MESENYDSEPVDSYQGKDLVDLEELRSITSMPQGRRPCYVTTKRRPHDNAEPMPVPRLSQSLQDRDLPVEEIVDRDCSDFL